VLNGFKEIVPAVSRLITPAILARYRANAAAMNNQAVFEIPNILQTIFERSNPSAKAEARGDAVVAD
ncbi:MAG TPA: hypothetical protein VN807_06735, partial [Candidatus Sulfotelmatobacter sp.]|nr:hypothetical protein [Candidatus Sulfotelmatobacter sp.]